MQDVTHILNAIREGSAEAARDLMPVVYEELRNIARQKMAAETPGHTLQATALVHEAWLRLAGPNQSWDSRGHFFSAAAEAMRRILVDHARRKKSRKRGGEHVEVEIEESDWMTTAPPDELLAVHEALDRLSSQDPQAAELVKLRYFVGLTMEEAASVLQTSKRSAESLWTYAKAWLRQAIRDAQ